MNIPSFISTIKQKIQEKKIDNRMFIIAGVFVLAVAFLGFGIVQYYRVSRELSVLKSSTTATPTISAQDQKKLIDQVSKLIVVPSDEVPSIAAVTDVEKLKDQPFFASAANGDRVVIYTNAKKAILYRPSVNKIIEVAPVNVGTPSPSGPTGAVAGAAVTPTGGPTPTPRATATPTPPAGGTPTKSPSATPLPTP